MFMRGVRRRSAGAVVVGVWSVLSCAGAPPPEAAASLSVPTASAASIAPAASTPASPVAAPPPAPARGFASDADVQRVLDERLGDLADDYGIIVGMVDASGRRVVGRGHLTRGDARVPDGDTLFELGSITKVFTSLLLAVAVERGEVGFDDPVVQHLPPGTTVPSVDGR